VLEIGSWFPSRLGRWIAAPFDEILSSTSAASVVDHIFDLEFFLLVDNVWWRSVFFDGRVKVVVDGRRA
jgi:hypothetical protein